MKDLENLPKQSERITLICSSLILAYERITPLGKDLNISQNKVLSMAKDLSNLYKEIPESYLIECIKRGSKGQYGKTFGISVNEIGSWWNKYKVEKKEEVEKEKLMKLPPKERLKYITRNQYHG